MATIDPFTRVLQTLVQLFRNSTTMASIGVKPANVIDISDSGFVQLDPLKQSPGASNLPEIIVVPARGKLMPYGGNSRTSTAMREFLICITTNSLRVGGELPSVGTTPLVTLFSVEWAMFRTFVGVNPNLGLNDPTVVAVKQYTLDVLHDKGLIDTIPVLARETNRWTGVLSCWCELYWSSQAIFPAATY